MCVGWLVGWGRSREEKEEEEEEWLNNELILMTIPPVRQFNSIQFNSTCIYDGKILGNVMILTSNNNNKVMGGGSYKRFVYLSGWMDG